MEDQSVSAPKQIRKDPVTIPFIVLLIVIAVLVPLATAAPIDLERAERPTPAPVEVSAEDLPALSELVLDASYEDPIGITMNYPAGWVVTPIQEGSFMLTNYPVPIENELPADFVGLQIDVLPLADFTIMADGSAPDSGTPVREIATILAELVAGSAETITITDTTVAELPAARFSVASTNEAFGTGEIILFTPDDATIALVQTSTTPENEANLPAFTDDILASITFTTADES